VVAPPLDDAFLSPFSGKLLEFLPSMVRFLRFKCTKFYFGWGSPDPLAGFKGPTSKRMEEMEIKGRGNIELNSLLLSNLTTA